MGDVPKNALVIKGKFQMHWIKKRDDVETGDIVIVYLFIS